MTTIIDAATREPFNWADSRMIAITFALPQESQDFIKALRGARLGGHGSVVGRIGAREVVIAHTGVGLASAEACARELLEAHRPEFVLSAGYAGGLDPTLAVGDILIATNFSSPPLLEAARAILGAEPRQHFGGLTSQSSVAETVAAKTQLAGETGALGVDMETAALAAGCVSAGVPLLSIRVISDAAGDPLPVPMEHWFDLQKQRPRVFSLLAFLATHPGRIAPFARFVSGLAPARRALTERLLRLARELP